MILLPNWDTYYTTNKLHYPQNVQFINHLIFVWAWKVLCLTLRHLLRDFQNIKYFVLVLYSFENKMQWIIKNSNSINKDIQPNKRKLIGKTPFSKISNDTLIRYNSAQASGLLLLGKALHTWLIPVNWSPQQQDKFLRKK